MVRPCPKNCEDSFRAQPHASSGRFVQMTADRKMECSNESANCGTHRLEGSLTLITHCAGMNVHQETIVVCVMLGGADETPEVEIRTYPTMTRLI